MDNIEKFKKEYMCEWINSNDSLNPTEMCLLHLYTNRYQNCQWIHNKMRENPNDNLDFLNYVIGRVCYELKINGEKIFDIVPHSGRIRPKKFDKYINIDTIPIIFGDEYYKVNEVYSDLHHVLSKQREEREKERYKDDYYFFKL